MSETKNEICRYWAPLKSPFHFHLAFIHFYRTFYSALVIFVTYISVRSPFNSINVAQSTSSRANKIKWSYRIDNVSHWVTYQQMPVSHTALLPLTLMISFTSIFACTHYLLCHLIWAVRLPSHRWEEGRVENTKEQCHLLPVRSVEYLVGKEQCRSWC